MSIHARFTHQAKLHPSRIAVRTKEESITYAALNTRANQLARYLQSQGLKQGMVVGIFCDRSIEMVVAIYAVLKAGGAYLPLDKKYPQGRLALLLAQSETRFILTDQAITQSELLAACVAQSQTIETPARAAMTANGSEREATPGDNINCIALTAGSTVADIAQQSFADLPECSAAPSELANKQGVKHSAYLNSRLAYLIYTSGSTGQPKGVMVAHKNTLALIDWAAQYFTEQELQCVVASTSLNFDLSVFELFVPLSVGGSILLVDNALCLAEKTFDCADITLLNTVPSVLQTLLDVDAELPEQLTVNVAGEPLPQASVNRAFAQWNVQRVVNLYGPSETTTYSTVYSMSSPVDEAPAIGKAIIGTELLVLDDKQQPVKAGQQGELYIAGLGVTLGYWQQAEITQERFLDIPSVLRSNNNFQQMYRTGDLVVQREDGNLQYLGRIDEQVKIRGFRVELAEIEYQLSAAPEIKHAVVNVIKSPCGQSRLIGYCLLEDSVKSDLVATDTVTSLFAEVLAQLSLRLPAYMVPEQLVQVDAWAYTPNGKIDKKQLPEPAAKGNQAAIVAPSSKTEVQLCQLWAQLLNADEHDFGVEDHFFALGGNSLLILQLMYRIESAFGVALQQHEIASRLTVKMMAELIEQRLASHGQSASLSMAELSKQASTAASIQQENFWVLDSILNHYHTDTRLNENMVFSVPFYLHFPEAFDLAQMQRAMEYVCRKHEVLRTGYSLMGTEIVTEVKDAFPTITHQIVACDSETVFANAARQALMAGRERVLNITSGHVVAATMVENALNREAILAIAVHHIAFDGWSKSVFIADLLAAYSKSGEQTLAVSEVELAQQPKYSAYGHWQRQQVLSSEWGDALTDIARRADSFQLVNEFPVEAPRSGRKVFTGGMVRRKLTPKTVNAVQLFAKSHHASLYDVMYSVLSLVIAKEGGQRECVIGAAAANRVTAEQAQMIGCFTTTLLLYTDIPQYSSYVDFLHDLVKNKETTFINQAIQISASLPQFDLEVPINGLHSPFLNIFLAEEINESGEYPFGDSKVRVLHSEDDVSRFDLICNYHVTDSGIELRWVYDEELYNAAAMNQYIDCFVEVIEQVIAQPQQCISEVIGVVETESTSDSIVPAAVAPILRGESRVFETDVLLHQYFERSVRTNPNSVAVYDGENTYTFAQINHAANRLAANIQRAVKHSVVAVKATHSVETIIAIMALWKAGAAYLPLDPKLPSARAAYMLEQAKVTRCLQAPHDNADALTLPDNIEIIEVTRSLTDVTQTHSLSENLPSVAGDNSLAYVLFTSGSTSQPKGVKVTHSNVVNVMHSIAELGIQDANGSWGLGASFCFDASVHGLTQLCMGYAICLLDESVRLAPEKLANQISKASIQVLDCTPTLLGQWYVDAPDLVLPNLMVGGEAIEKQLWQQIVVKTQASGCIAYNAYGPTECTVNCTLGVITGDEPHIGGPLLNTSIQIVNSQGEPCGVNEQGEICVSGAGVTQGYLHSELALLDADNSDSPAYKTGDLGYIDAQHRLIFSGRETGYIKHLGYRISPLEIEAQINANPAVVRSHVCVITVASSTSLVAFVEWQAGVMDGRDISALDGLKQQLAEYLPSYMLPTRFISIELWPVMVTGKLDAKALAAKAYESVDVTSAQSPVEFELQAVLNQLLQQDSHSALNFSLSFAQLGGSSVQGAKLATMLSNTFAVSMSLVDILLANSLHELAQSIESKQSQTSVFDGFTTESSDFDNVVEESI